MSKFKMGDRVRHNGGNGFTVLRGQFGTVTNPLGRGFPDDCSTEVTWDDLPGKNYPFTTSLDLVSSQDVHIQDQRTRQLINELYHDRARLERVAKKASALLNKWIILSADMEYNDENERAIWSCHIGASEGFVEDHGA